MGVSRVFLYWCNDVIANASLRSESATTEPSHIFINGKLCIWFKSWANARPPSPFILYPLFFRLRLEILIFQAFSQLLVFLHIMFSFHIFFLPFYAPIDCAPFFALCFSIFFSWIESFRRFSRTGGTGGARQENCAPPQPNPGSGMASLVVD